MYHIIMFLIVGLGNPDKKYIKTRHNIGFLVLDKFQEENNLPGFLLSKKYDSLISEGNIENEKVILAKPQTFMNNSGRAIKSLTKLLSKQEKIKNLIIIHDDIDLPLGKIRIIKNRGSAGHKGVDSIVKEIKNKNFIRLRIGINPKDKKSENPQKFVLQKFTKDEEKIIEQIIEKNCQALKIILVQGIEKAMNEFN